MSSSNSCLFFFVYQRAQDQEKGTENAEKLVPVWGRSISKAPEGTLPSPHRVHHASAAEPPAVSVVSEAILDATDGTDARKDMRIRLREALGRGRTQKVPPPSCSASCVSRTVRPRRGRRSLDTSKKRARKIQKVRGVDHVTPQRASDTAVRVRVPYLDLNECGS